MNSIYLYQKIAIKGVFRNTLVGLGKVRGGSKSFKLSKGGDKKVYAYKEGGIKSLPLFPHQTHKFVGTLRAHIIDI